MTELVILPDFDEWGEDPLVPRSDWRDAVANEDTNLGYWEWVEHNRCDYLLDK